MGASHFMIDRARIRWVTTKEKDGSPVTVMIVHLPKGITLPGHRHPDHSRSFLCNVKVNSGFWFDQILKERGVAGRYKERWR